jgi:hypothetical protein
LFLYSKTYIYISILKRLATISSTINPLDH